MAYLQGAQSKMQSEKEGQSRSEIMVVDSDWPSGLLNRGHLPGHPDERQPGTVMSTEQQHYLAYMLRLWQVSNDGEPIWRTSLESPHTGERHGFASLEMLFAFLEEQTGGQLKRKEQPKDISEN
jgi:hypothetical protein